MASVIKVRTISAATETAIQLVNSQFARTLNFGTNWTQLRVGVRMHMTNTGGALTTAKFYLGLCAGTSNQVSDASTTHFVGITTNGTWQFQTTFYNATSPSPFKRVGTTGTTGTNFSLTNLAIPCGAASATADRVAWFVDITKGSPNYSFKMFGPNNSVPADVSASTFLTQMEAGTPSISGHSATDTQTIAVNEGTDGTLDSFAVSWDHTTPVIELCDIALARIA